MRILLLSALYFLFSFNIDKSISSNVYICNSPSAKVYHQDRTCRGLQNCKQEINTVSLNDAVKIYGRRACKICY